MAIVEMNKFTLLTLKTYKENLLKKIQEFSNVEFIDLKDDDVLRRNPEFQDFFEGDFNVDTQTLQEKLLKIKEGIDFLVNYIPKKTGIKSFEDDKESLTVNELENFTKVYDWEEAYLTVKNEEVKINNLENELMQLQSEIEQLIPWSNLDIAFEELEGLNKATVLLGNIPKQYEKNILEELEDCYVEIISKNSNSINFLLISDKIQEDKILNVIRGFGFVQFKPSFKGKAVELIEQCNIRIKNIKEELFSIKESLKNLNNEYRVLRIFYDYYASAIERQIIEEKFLKSTNTVVIQGWCPVDLNEKLESICDSVSKDDYWVVFQEVSEDEIDEVPIELKNNKLNSTFESVTQMYSYPKYNEVDPTPLLTPFYLVFFGMMVADAGYGLVMLLATYCAMKFLKLSKKNRDFIKFFYYLSYPTILFGLIYGSVFGDVVPIPKLIDTSKDINSVLALSLVLGVIQIFFGLGIKAYILISAGKIKDAFYDVGSWVIALVSAGILGGSIALNWSSTIKNIGIWGLVIGSILIVLTGGREEKTKGAQIGQGLYALYGITSYVGDLVSYTRLMALGLAGGSIAGALNLLISQLPGIAAVLVMPILFILVHIFNLLLSLLGAYVHTARLQYVEYFSKFYEGGGKPFAPFKSSEKYINIKND